MTGEQVRQARLAAGLSQQRLSELLEINQTLLSRIEEGKRELSSDLAAKAKDALIRATAERNREVLDAVGVA